MTDEQAIRTLYEDMYKAMIAKDTVALGKILSEDSVLVHMTGYRQSRKEYLSEIASGSKVIPAFRNRVARNWG